MKYENIEELVYKLLLLMPTLQKRILKSNDVTVNSKLSPLQFYLIVILNENGILSMSELSKNICISKQQLTPMIDKLIDVGFVERSFNKNDRRIINVKLNDKGLEFLNGTKIKMSESLTKKLNLLSKEDVDKLLASIDTIFEVTRKLV